MTTLKAQKWEFEAAILLSEASYGLQPNSETESLEKFRSEFSVLGDHVSFFCTGKGQKYIIAVCQREQSRVLFCAFAGTHLPGDWKRTNINILRSTNATEVGAPGHAGFLERALEVPLEGIERMAREAKASRIVLCGHSLGGAVSHFVLLRWLYGLRSKKFDKENILSIAIGAPFFGGTNMLDHIKRHGWLDCFITLVNGSDPVPRIMNLAAALVEHSTSKLFATLLSACCAVLSYTDSGAGPASVLDRLAQEIRKVSAQDNYSAMLSYIPIGRYVIFLVDGEVRIGDDRNVVDLLGSVQLLCAEPSIINGFLDRNALAQHHIKAYQNILQARRSALSQHSAKPIVGWNSGLFRGGLEYDGSSGDDSHSYASDLVPKIHEISCETFTSHNSQCGRIIKFRGCNLDFVAGNAIKIDVEGLDPNWSSDLVRDSRVCRRSSNVLEVEQFLSLEDKRSRPKHDVCIEVQSDVVADGNGRAKADVILKRSNCRSSSDTPQDALRFYGGQFFLDTQQHAWMMKKLFGDKSLYEKLEALADSVDGLKCIGGRGFLRMQYDWHVLEDIGNPPEDAPHQDSRQLREELYEWIVPSEGLVVRTQTQQTMGIAAVVAAVVIGGGIVASGGLGIVGGLVGSGGSLTGGYGTFSLLTASTGSAAYFLMRQQLRNGYYIMLEDLVKLFAGTKLMDINMTEMKLEETLLRVASEFERNVRDGNVERNEIPLYDCYNKASQAIVEQRVMLIGLIHEIKKERNRGHVVTICGPRDSGKTTLVSQLLHRPDLALSTGLAGGQGETRQVVPYSFPGVFGFALLDTPGLTGTEEAIRGKFDKAALNLSSTFVYIREYEGLPTEVDVQFLIRILYSAAHTKFPNILVCLNRAKHKLTEDAAGEFFDLTATEQKKKWLRRLREPWSGMSNWMKQMMSCCNITVEFVELNGDSQLEEELAWDDRTFGMWTTSSIGKWIAQSIVAPEERKTNESWAHLSAHLESFSHKKWSKGVHEARREKKQSLRTPSGA